MLIAVVSAAAGVNVANSVCIHLWLLCWDEQFIVELIKGGFSVVLEQDSVSYSEAAVIWFNSCPPCPLWTAACMLSCSDKVFMSYHCLNLIQTINCFCQSFFFMQCLSVLFPFVSKWLFFFFNLYWKHKGWHCFAIVVVILLFGKNW